MAGVAGVALGDMGLHFAWQVWRLMIWILTLRARDTDTICRHTTSYRRLLCVAGVALGDMDLHFAWQAWHLVTWILILRGRRGTYGVGLALVARLGLRCHRGRRGFLRGRRGTW